jgi:Flp pilus assembly protein TadG
VRPPLPASFLKDARGAVAVEFALIAPAFFTMLVGSVELALYSYAQVALEAGARAASRTGYIGVTDSDGDSTSTTVAAIEATIKKYAIGPFDFVNNGGLRITISIYRSWSELPEPYVDSNQNGQYDAGEAYVDLNGNGRYDRGGPKVGTGPGGSNQIVLYEVRYRWKPITPLIGALLTGSVIGETDLVASAVVQNEPWDGPLRTIGAGP